MVTTLHPNGAGARKAFPRQPVLVEPVALPFHGDYAGITIHYNVDAVRGLLDADAAGLHALNADLEAQEAALDADTTLTDADRDAARSPLWLASAQRVIRAAVVAVEWPYDDAPPDPATPETWGWHDPILVWIGQTGLQVAGAAWGGPLAVQARRNTSWSITASLLRTLHAS